MFPTGIGGLVVYRRRLLSHPWPFDTYVDVGGGLALGCGGLVTGCSIGCPGERSPKLSASMNTTAFCFADGSPMNKLT